MKSKKFFVIYALAVGLFSAFVITGCSSDESENNQAPFDGLVDVLGAKVEMKNNTLALNSESELQDLVSKLKTYQSVSTRQGVEEVFTSKKNETLIDGFVSIYDVFVDAMMNAESYYDREGGYEEFKEKYSTLYYPETGDDISAYLPVSDPYLSKFLNQDGEITIAGKTLNMKDISTYEQLKELNLSPQENSENENIATTRSTIPLIYNTFGGEPVILTIGKSTKIGQRKIGVDKRKVEKNPPYYDQARFDIVFRKRGFLNAWYNHWALTKNRIYLFHPKQESSDIDPSKYTIFVPITHEGFSSHDQTFWIENWMISHTKSGNYTKKTSICASTNLLRCA